jgi:DNA-nicking Smr family endonuclease
MAKKKPTQSDDDAQLWAQFTKDIEPARKVDRVTPPRRAPAPSLPEAPPKKAAAPRAPQPGPAPGPPAPKPAPVRSHGDTPGVDARTAANLKRGKLPIDGTIDLHGMDRESAAAALTRFIDTRQAAGARCVLVITGKGLNQGGEGRWSPGVLRQAVPEWLNAPPLAGKVLAFSYAQPHHGGSGALYVLLKRRR